MVFYKGYEIFNEKAVKTVWVLKNGRIIDALCIENGTVKKAKEKIDRIGGLV